MKTFEDPPIKIVYEGAIQCEASDDGDIIISRPVTPSELAAIFGVDEIDILDGGIGIFTLNEEKENNNEN